MTDWTISRQPIPMPHGMNDQPMTCPICRHPVKDGLACAVCTTHIRRDLEALPGWMTELDLQLTRQGQLGTGNGGRSADTPLMYDTRSAETRDIITNTIHAWVRNLQETHRSDPGDNITQWCAWLIDRLPHIRGHQNVRPMADEMRHCVHLAIHAVDLPTLRLNCGPCPTCGNTVTAPIGADQGVCRHCSWAGAESTVTVDHSLPSVLDRAKDALVSRRELLAAARLYQVDVDRRRLSEWVKTGRLKASHVTDEGTPQYRVGDVLELAKLAQAVK